MNLLRRYVLLMAAPLLGLCTGQAAFADTDRDIAAVRAVFEQVVADWNSGNLRAIIDSLAQDAVRMPPGAPALVGKDKITAYTTSFHQAYLDNWQVDIKSIEVSGTCKGPTPLVQEPFGPKRRCDEPFHSDQVWSSQVLVDASLRRRDGCFKFIRTNSA